MSKEKKYGMTFEQVTGTIRVCDPHGFVVREAYFYDRQRRRDLMRRWADDIKRISTPHHIVVRLD